MNVKIVQPRALRLQCRPEAGLKSSGFIRTVGRTTYDTLHFRRNLHPNSSPVICEAKKGVGSILRDALSPPSGQHNLAIAGGNFLRTLGIENNIEITRILDICTNPNSIFCTKRGQPVNPYVSVFAAAAGWLTLLTINDVVCQQLNGCRRAS